MRVARAVALAFIDNDNPQVKTEVSHKDYNRANDCAENLEWVSHTENIRYSVCNRKDITGENNPNFGNKKLSQKYSTDKQLSLEKQSRKGTKNGRARSIKVYRDGKCIGSFDYISPCCDFINVLFGTNSTPDTIRSRIDTSIRTCKPYKGLTFRKF